MDYDQIIYFFNYETYNLEFLGKIFKSCYNVILINHK